MAVPEALTAVVASPGQQGPRAPGPVGSGQEVLLSSSSLFLSGSAGAVLAQQSSLNISKLSVRGCRAETNGGAFLLQSSQAAFYNTRLENNTVRHKPRMPLDLAQAPDTLHGLTWLLGELHSPPATSAPPAVVLVVGESQRVRWAKTL
jgi:hypothetical protein